MSVFTLRTTQRKKPLFQCKGFGYIIDQKKSEKAYWKCEYAGKMKCQGRVHNDPANTTLLFGNDNHNHLGMLYLLKFKSSKEKFVFELLPAL